jgi:hypothetical protein
MRRREHLRVLVSFLFVLQLAAAAWPQAAQVISDPRILEARRLFDETQYEAVLVVLDRVIGDRAPGELTPVLRQEVASAHELRGRARFNLANEAGATEDFRAVLALAPAYLLPETASPRVRTAFEALRTATVGGVTLQVTPADAEVTIDGISVDWRQGPIALVAGQHRLAATRPAHAALEQAITVPTGPPIDVPVALLRTSATATIVTVPEAVEVLVNGVPQGTTAAATSPAPPEWVTRYKMPPTAFSAPLLLSGLGTGEHRIQLRRPCHKPEERVMKIDQLDDRVFEPIVLTPAIGTVEAPTAATAGATLFVDGLPKGPTPLTISDICEGRHTLEVRTPHGRLVQRAEIQTGQRVRVEGTIKPAFAVVSAWSAKAQPRGGPDLRLEVERVLGAQGSVVVFASDDDTIKSFMTEQKLGADWLASRPDGSPTSTAADALSPQARQDLVAQLARKLDVQGLASITVPADGEADEIWVSLFAAGGGRPDVLVVHLDDATSVGRTSQRLASSLTLLRPTLGLLAIDVMGVEGAVVAALQADGPGARGGLALGDRITALSSTPIRDAVDLRKRIEALPPDAPVDVRWIDRMGATKDGRLQPARTPDSVSVADRAQLFNKAIVDLRHRLVTAEAAENPVIQLNLAVALMGTEAWAEASRLLQEAKLPQGPGVSQGTVQYLLGLCYEQLRQFADAERAFRAAAGAEGSLLTQDGPPVKELAEARVRALAAAR